LSEPTLHFQNGLHAATVRHLALRLCQAEHSLNALTSGSIDALIDAGGHTYLLRHEQDRLRRSEARLQALFDTIPDVITVLNESGEVRYQSPAVTRVLGYDSGALVGRSVFEFVHPDDLPGFEREVSEVIHKVRATTTAEFRHKTRDGSWCRLEATLGSGQPMGTGGVVLTFRDVTSRRQRQDESHTQYVALDMACHAKDRVLAMLAHELRTPLTPALLGITALEEDPRFAAAKPTLAMIRRNIELESRLLEGLLDFTQISQGKVRLKLDSIDAHEAVRNALEVCHKHVSAKQIDVRLHLEAEEHCVRADEAKLQQIIWNLVKTPSNFRSRVACSPFPQAVL
jgi:PAS domain S-box-containing protein